MWQWQTTRIRLNADMPNWTPRSNAGYSISSLQKKTSVAVDSRENPGSSMSQGKTMDTLRSYFFRNVSHHALAGSLRLNSKAALMPQRGLCAEKTLHSRACHLSRCMPTSLHVLCIRAVRVGAKSRFAQVCLPVLQGTFCFCLHVSIDERSDIQRVARVFHP